MDRQGDYKALFEFATEGILVTNSKGEIVSINPSAERMFCYDKGELLGKKIEMLIPRRFTQKHTGDRDTFIHNPHPRAMGSGIGLFGMKKNGFEFPVEVSLSPFTNNEGGFVMAFMIDITSRKEKEDQIKKAHLELQHSAEEIKATNAELENFAYISSHDLQEPLRKILSFGERLKLTDGEVLSEKGKDYLARMLNASTRMQSLISDLLKFSRLAKGVQGFADVDLNAILSEVLSDMEVTIEKTGARIEAQKLPLIEAEPTQMRQLFQNLISNAIKFRKDNDVPLVKIYVNREIPGSEFESPKIELYFEDNGTGFDEKYNDRIFNIFQRLEAQKYEGSGIGLAICRKIAQRHGGNILAKSEVGKGSTFIVTLATKQKTNP